MDRTKSVTEYGLTELLDSASNQQRYPAAAAISDALQVRVGDVSLPGGSAATSYWLPWHMLRDLNAGVPSQGGNLTTAQRFMALIAAARPATVLAAAGAQVVTVTGVGTAVVPQAEEVVSSGWIAEGAAAKQVELRFETGSASPRTVAGRILMSPRLIRQGMDGIETAILNELRRSNLSVAEAGFFNGSGSSGEPLGLFNTPGRQSVTFAGATPTFNELIKMVEEALDEEADFSQLTFFTHPKMLTALMRTQIAAGSGDMVASCIHGPRQLSMGGLPVMATSAIPEGKMLLCDPTRINLVYWNEPAIVIDRFSGGKSISGAAELLTFDDCDIVAGRPAEIVVGSAA